MKKKGFTLIELLVVIAIIGVLSTILMVSFSGIRERNRDAKRKADLLEIKTALELYRSDKGFYPVSTGTAPAGNVLFPNCGQDFVDSTAGTIYMKKVPCDPKTGVRYVYVSSSPYSQYTLKACIENTRDQDPNVLASDSDCASPLRPYTLTNP